MVESWYNESFKHLSFSDFFFFYITDIKMVQIERITKDV